MARERIIYRFGRSAFRDFEAGNTKEWLLSNGIGGYANGTVHGNGSRIFSAYLIASLHPPVERVLVLAKTHEELIFSGEEAGRGQLFSMRDVPPEASTEGLSVERKDLATQQYPGYVRAGYRYQTGFTFDLWPEYRYETDGISVRKSIALTYGKNETAICYELVNNGSRQAVFSVTPLFNFRPFGSVSEKGDLAFGVECLGGRLVLTPRKAPGYRICFSASEGEFFDRGERKTSMATPNYRIEENELYCVDVGNGFTGVDNHFTPYELHVVLAPGERKELGLLCGLYGHKEAAAEGLFFGAGPGGEGQSVKEEPEDRGDNRAGRSEAEDNGVWGGAKDRPDVLTRVKQIFAAAKERGEALLEQAGAEDALTGRLVLSADHFLVRRESTGLKTVLAGYPWFADWGRDTMIAFAGLTLATGRFDDAREVLKSFAQYVSRGMLPNVFPNNAGEEPMYNTIDASLWYFYAVYKYLQYTTGLSCYRGQLPGTEAGREGRPALCAEEIFIRDEIYPALCEIFISYRDGLARYGIHMDADGLILGGGGLDQLTWMDVRVGNIVVTPRHGKAVEINALWYNAICCMRLFGERFAGGDARQAENIPCDGELEKLAERVRRSFCDQFWDEEKGYLCDTVEEDGTGDTTLRPNQIFAVSLPFTMLSSGQEQSIVRTVYEKLYTPYGLRSLAPGEDGYRGEYAGRLIGRDLSYHMGTTWGFLSGAFFDAWAKTMCQDAQGRALLKGMLENFEDHMADGCLGGIAEIFDGDFACGSRGCYTQAWSVAEVLRAWREIHALSLW